MLSDLFSTDPDWTQAIVRLILGVVFFAHGRNGLFLNWFGDRKGHGYEYHLLAIALAAVIVVKGSGAASLDRLFFN